MNHRCMLRFFTRNIFPESVFSFLIVLEFLIPRVFLPLLLETKEMSQIFMYLYLERDVILANIPLDSLFRKENK